MVLARSLRVLTVATVSLAATVAVAAVVVRQPLTATSKAPNAKGHAKLVLKSPSRGKFTVSARGLPANGTFDVVVRGVRVGTLTTNGTGAGKAKFHTGLGSATGGRLGFDPRGTVVVVRDNDAGDDDLVGEMPDDGDSASGAFACCRAEHDGGDDCEERTPAECTAHGGTPSTVASCLPDPCASTHPANTVCCISSSSAHASEDEAPEVECDEDMTSSECTAAGGTVLTATSCDGDPCAQTPPESVLACCVLRDQEPECMLLTPEACTSEKGSASSATSCDSDPCSTGSGD